MSTGRGEPIEIYRAESLTEAHELRLVLESAGISARVENEHLQGGIGVVLGGWSMAPRLVVASTDEAAARTTIDSFLSRQRPPATSDESNLTCLSCGTAIGLSTECAACGWTYGQIGQDPVVPDLVPAESDEESPAPPISIAPPVHSRSAVLGEVGAVLAIGIVPHISNAIVSLASPSPPIPFWLDGMSLTISCCCTIFAVLYLIHRSGEGWERFGITRPRWWDLLIGAVCFVIAVAIVPFCIQPIPWDENTANADWPGPSSTVEYVLLILMYSGVGVAEELVCRAYLITRLEQLLESRGFAVVVSALLFALSHIYQGPPGAINAALLGLAYGSVYLMIRRLWPLAIGHAAYDIFVVAWT